MRECSGESASRREPCRGGCRVDCDLGLRISRRKQHSQKSEDTQQGARSGGRSSPLCAMGGKNFHEQMLAARRAAHQPAAESSEFCAHGSSSYPHFFGYGNAQNLFSPNRGIVLLAAVASGNKLVVVLVDKHKPVNPKEIIRSC